jgi:hypothetical protein
VPDTVPPPPPASCPRRVRLVADDEAHARPAAHRLDRDGHRSYGHVIADGLSVGFDRPGDEPFALHAVGAGTQNDRATGDLDRRRLVLALARSAA